MMTDPLVAVYAQAFGLETVIVVVGDGDFGDGGGGADHGEAVGAVVVEVVVAY